MGPENLLQILWKISQYSKLLSYLFSYYYFMKKNFIEL